ncbi:hypothetical protein IF128_12975 [Empedobacter stercoris]|uniref:hypothetical protein n=1 Tax=Empedobacter stercoris TaxID=1628248 RepID=UPI0016628387|nr:hypothetical protein [Empedobacter stercoris]MCA4810641.1 hypothetical protein [Empedobacter stercoris]QNT13193.1 hypothetical protein HNV03_01235 [Empedobacter stercoris]
METLELNTNKRKAAGNIGLAIWRLKCFYGTFVQGPKTVILLNFCAKNPPHRQAEKRYVPFLNDNANRYRQTNEFT